LKIPGIMARCLLIICLPVLFLTASLAWGFNSTWIFSHGFQKYHVSDSTGIPVTELEKIGASWVRYINFSDDYWHISLMQNSQTFELFTREEQVHFRDVKQLIWLDYRILIIFLVLVLAYILVSIFWRRGKYRGPLARSVIWGSGLTLLLIIILGAASFLDFDQIFLQLHYLIFTNQFWSAQGYMLMLFPGGFWYDATLFCIGFMAGLAGISGFISWIYLRIRKRGKTN
jgi:integral membrane protein (TIGR01906 family)